MKFMKQRYALILEKLSTIQIEKSLSQMNNTLKARMKCKNYLKVLMSLLITQTK